MYDISYWKSQCQSKRVRDKNCEGTVKRITKAAFASKNDWDKLQQLLRLEGISYARASAILHLYDEGLYPIIDVYAVWSVDKNESELLSLKVDDVYQNGTPVTDLLFDKSIVKGGEVSRAVPVNADGRDAIEALIGWHAEGFDSVKSDRFLFPSRQTTGAIDRRTAHEALKKAFEAAGLNGKLATHSMRKSFAQRLYDQTADIFAVQELLGHKSVATTQRYLGVNYATVREAVEKMAFSATERDIDTLSTQTLKTTSDHALFLELAMRGYDLSALRNAQKPVGALYNAEINAGTIPPLRTV